jgi:O-antigen biosynthesis protein
MIGAVSFRRRAAAPRLIDWTGERCVPWAPDVQVVYEHFHRYLWASSLVRGRRVLDLGSGEGFGAALLSESARHVVGVDVDELTVEHSKLNYAGPNLEFHLGTALDLSALEDGSFGAVVAFEIIEHVREQDRVLAEVERVLDEDGLLVISTPERRAYGDARNEPNPFHVRELSLEEFLELLGSHFPHTAAWGQRTITGSHLNPLGHQPAEGAADAPSEFFIERAGDEWRLADGPAALYCVALASKAPLGAVPTSSTLADCEIELVRAKERDTAAAIADTAAAIEEIAGLEAEKHEYAATLQRERAHHERVLREREAEELHRQAELQQRLRAQDQELSRVEETLASTRQTAHELHLKAGSLHEQLAAERLAGQRVAESVTWQTFQELRGRLYRALGGERSRRARMLGATLRFTGRHLNRRPAASSPQAGATAPEREALEIIAFPGYERPTASLVIPLYAHAELTRACLRSIRDHTTRVAYEVILIDDAADGQTKRLLEGVQGATILRNDTNIGYLRSMNRAAAAARGTWMVLFNNDTEVTPGWLAAMLACAESAPDIGVVTPKFVYPDGMLNEAGGIIWRDGTGVNYGRGDRAERFQYEYRRETDYGSAAALMVSAELWREVGGFDERFLPMFYEDVDLCFQARERGLRVVYEPKAVVVHVEGATTGSDLASGHKRFQEQNRPKLVAKWRHRLDADHKRSAPANLVVAADRHRGPHVLVIDHRVPMWDRDAGSLRILKIMEALIGLGARITFMPENFAAMQPYTRELQSMGIEVLYGELDPRAELAARGPWLTTAILCRPHPASQWLDTVREFAPGAAVVYDTVDLHWLREARRSEITSSHALAYAGGNGNSVPASIPPKAAALRELELAMMRATDATMVVSNPERDQVLRDVPQANVLVVPTVHDVEPFVAPAEEREGILFLGGFEHVPNVDAAVRLVGDVMPGVWKELGDVEVTIVGSSPPPEVQALASHRVDVAGWVEDLEPLMRRARLMVAPLRFGAGVKGKITQCLAMGLPVVTTGVGAEGLDVTDGESMLIADDPSEIADRVVRCYRDEELWQRISAAGQSVIATACSPKAVEAQMRLLLGEVAAVDETLASQANLSLR